MKRKIIRIDREKCNGCGACAEACHEGAIQMIDGVATLTREDYCDGLGDCLPACPVGAIAFEEREAPAYDAAAIRAGRASRDKAQADPRPADAPSRLRQWPVQIRLAPVNAPWFEGARLLVAADCSAYAYGNFHEDFIRGRVCLVGCPKLDGVDYSEKLAAILEQNHIRNITVARMEVPCCGGLEYAVRRALERSGRTVPLRVVTLGVDGRIVKD